MTLEDGQVTEVAYNAQADRRILSMDESQHPFSTVVDRGGSKSKTYGTSEWQFQHDLICQ